ncbi:MAG: beta-ketoacyl synthase N-terminal-like domain-containing protein, partial [Steroidobacteraceae bacterium]
AGVDVVINTLPGDALQKGLRCLASGGRYIEIAMTALKTARAVDLSVLQDNQAFHSINLRGLLAASPQRFADYWAELNRLLAAGAVRPTIMRSFPFPQLAEAYRSLEDRGNIGKVIVDIPPQLRLQPARGVGRGECRPEACEDEPIAIIGMSGRFGRADDVHELWRHLAAGTDLTEEVSRWPLPVDDEDEPQRQCRRGGLLRDVDVFDPMFFNISALEATYMDPQQRLFLQEAWKALEDAGHTGDDIRGARCAVYVGCAGGDYQQLVRDGAPAQAFWGNTGSVVSARIAYHLDLHGPAITVDTACSSSLVAVHLACQALRAREADLALAGGVFVQSTPGFYRLANRAGMLSPSGRCHAFDASADGFVPGEGVGAVVLKRLADAQADRDNVYGVIRGSGINQDGATNGITAPSAASQERLERSVYDTFGIDPRQIQMIEAHGTGTRLGDPIEFEALQRTFVHYTAEKRFCALGSIKTNIGHAASAAGIAGLIKVLLALRHRQMPPSLNYSRSNPYIDFENSPFYVNVGLQTWETRSGASRCAAVSSFGLSGTNAHLVVAEGPSPMPPPSAPGYLIALSARTDSQLRMQAKRLVDHCRQTAVDCGPMSFTLLMGRRHFAHRLARVVRTAGELVDVLERWLANGGDPSVCAGSAQKVPAQAALEAFASEAIRSTCGAQSADEYRRALTTAGELHVQGCRIDFAPLFSSPGYQRIPLPTYPFAQERYWVAAAGATRERAPRPLADAILPLAASSTAVTVEHARDYLRAALAELLRLPPEALAYPSPITEFGVDSVLAMHLIRQVESGLQVTISARELVEHPSIEALAAVIAAKSHGGRAPDAGAEDAGDSSESPLQAFKNGRLDIERIKEMIEHGEAI